MTKQDEGGAVEVEIIDRACDHESCEGKDTYRVEVSCMNCGWRGEQRVTVGHEPNTGRAIGAECPRCEVRWLQKGSFIGREAAGA